MADIFGREPKQVATEVKEDIKMSSFLPDSSLLAQEVYQLAKSNKELNIDRFARMAADFEMCAVNDSKYNYYSEYELNKYNNGYSLSDWKTFLSLACVQNFITSRKIRSMGEMICIFEDDIRRQKDLGEGIQAQTINGLQKLIETYQKFMNVTENKQTFITTFIPEKNYESIISNKVIQTDVMKIEQDTSIKNEEEE